MIKSNIKSISKRIDSVLAELTYLQQLFDKSYNSDKKISRLEDTIKHLTDLLEDKDKAIKALLDKKCEDESLELLIIKTYRGKPCIIKDGKRLDDDTMTGFDACWSIDFNTEVNINNK